MVLNIITPRNEILLAVLNTLPKLLLHLTFTLSKLPVLGFKISKTQKFAKKFIAKTNAKKELHKNE